MIVVWLTVVAWLKKWGVWIAGAVAGIVLLLLRRRTVPGPSPVQQRAEKQASEAEDRAMQVAEAEKQAATKEHEQDLVTVVAAEREKNTKIEENPEEVNAYLREAGESVKRGKT